jgi:hypothetical protein
VPRRHGRADAGQLRLRPQLLRLPAAGHGCRAAGQLRRGGTGAAPGEVHELL